VPLRREPAGRDLGLTIRMAFALAIVGAFYLVAAAFLLFVFVAGVVDGDWEAIVGGPFFLVGLVVLFRKQLRDSERAALRAARAKVVPAGERAELEVMLARLAQLADVPVPRLALAHSRSANALSAGSREETAVVVTTELLRRLDGRELEAVLAHEVGHLVNRDTLVMTFVSGPALLGSALWHDDDQRSKIPYLLFYWPVHAVTLIVMLAMSRYREYSADRVAALLTGRPQDLVSALLALDGLRPPTTDLRGRAVQALCIVPTRRRSFELLADHPPVAKRVSRLEELARSLGKVAA
jgi:heat shock protein HtpX